MTARLSWATDGSSLQVRHDATGRSFTVLKAPDMGHLEQTISFVFSESEWSSESFDALTNLLQGADYLIDCEINGATPERVLTCSLKGRWGAIAFVTERLLSEVLPALGLNKSEMVTYRLRATVNSMIYTRANTDEIRAWAREDSPWLLRAYGRLLLRDHEAARRQRERRRKHFDEVDFKGLISPRNPESKPSQEEE